MHPFRRSHAWLVSVLAAAVVALPAVGAWEPPPATAFTSQVLAHFHQWDTDSDGVLEPGELDALVVDSTLRGKPAAAAGTLKAAQRSTKVVVPPITMEYLHSYEEAVAKKQKVTPNFDRSFARVLKRIEAPKRELLEGEHPSLESCRQGPLGDCYLVSVIGAAVVRDSKAVMGMISSTREGEYLVKFGDGQEVAVKPMTDAELALTSSTGANGLWLPILEKAYGSIRTETLPEEKQSDSSTDAIARGGSTTATIRLLTGHMTERIGLLPRTAAKKKSEAKPDANTDVKSDPKAATNPDVKPIQQPDAKWSTTQTEIDPALIEKHLAVTLPKVRERLVTGVRDRRLIAAGTPKIGKMPPGVNPNHAYAVLGYDEKADVIDLWNPHGNTFTPKGTPGLEFGYPTKGGKFSMPLNEFAHVFAGITFETAKDVVKK